ncbi:hypothetical protein J8J22_22560, partial [Mycobacterium tuberculosis]|nr:hypothetical protein [Mycobacterium tuberculosis]
GQPDLVALVERHLDDPAPIVRGAAVWALGELVDAAHFATLQIRYAVQEGDASVLTEWRNAGKKQ